MRVWVVRLGEGGKFADICFEKGVAAIGWSEIGDVTNLEDYYELRKKVYVSRPDHYAKEGDAGGAAGMIWTFFKTIKTGDAVLSPEKRTRKFLVGTVTGNAAYDPNVVDREFPNVMPISWHNKVPYDDLPEDVLSSMTASQTLFELTSPEALQAVASLIGDRVPNEDHVEASATGSKELVQQMDPGSTNDTSKGVESIENERNLLFDDEADDSPVQISSEHSEIHFKTPNRKVRDVFSDYKRGDLDVRPVFQRGYVWDRKKASRLIESILLGVPIPVIYSAETQDGGEIIIDGQQRLLSVFSFMDGLFPRGGDFRLTGMGVMRELNGKTFKELDRTTQRCLENYSIPFISITKESNPDVKFEIFERLNTGSVKLNDQELRNCIFRGKYNDMLRELGENAEFHSILAIPALEYRMHDRELVLRFFAFYNSTYLKYKAPMRQFLNKEMDRNRDLNDGTSAEMREAFRKSVALSKTVFGENSFKRFVGGTQTDPNGSWETRKMNMGLFDIVMWGFTQYDKSQIVPKADAIREELIYRMTEDQRFLESLRVSTDKPENVQYRFDTWRLSLGNIIGSAPPEQRAFSSSLKKQLFDSDPTCAICGQKIMTIDDAALDHIEFYWRGGKTIPSNARLTHRFCNTQRGGRDANR